MVQDSQVARLQSVAQNWEDGDAAAAELFVNEIRPTVKTIVYGLNYRRFMARVDTDDLVQIVCLQLTRVASRKQLAKVVNQVFFGWLKKFVTYTVMREIRNQCAQKRDWNRELALTHANDRSFNPSYQLDQKLMIDEALDRLDSQQKSLVQLLVMGANQSEIAREFAVNPRTVRRRIASLRKLFQAHCQCSTN